MAGQHLKQAQWLMASLLFTATQFAQAEVPDPVPGAPITKTKAPEKPAAKADKPKAVAANNKKGKDGKLPVAPAAYEPLNCATINAKMGHLILMAKTKDGDKYGEMELGCIPFSETSSALDDMARKAIDLATSKLLGMPNVIRVYLDMIVPPFTTQETEKKFREQAFTAKVYLTEKGVFSHVKDIRKTQLPEQVPTTTAELAPAPTVITAKAKRSKTAAAPKRNPSKEYAYHVNKDYVPYTQTFPVMYSQSKQDRLEFLPMESVYFIYDRDVLTERSQATLDAIGEYVMQQPGVDRVIVRGHADSRGSDNYNYRLTDRRAMVVRDYLASAGISTALIEVSSRGEIDPVDSNDDREGQARNRRVEIFLVQRHNATPPTP